MLLTAIGGFNDDYKKKVDCHPCFLVGIAKHLNTRLDSQPTDMSCLCLVYSLFNLAISQEIRHFLLLFTFF